MEASGERKDHPIRVMSAEPRLRMGLGGPKGKTGGRRSPVFGLRPRRSLFPSLASATTVGSSDDSDAEAVEIHILERHALKLTAYEGLVSTHSWRGDTRLVHDQEHEPPTRWAREVDSGRSSVSQQATIRRRLGAAVELLGKSLVVNRQGDVACFWEEISGSGPRRRGWRRKTNA